MTSAYNEADFIEETLGSVARQTVAPVRYVVVSDGSTDETDAIARRYAERFDFIEFHRVESEGERNFARKVRALRLACEKLAPLDFDFIGSLDADVSFEPDYFTRLIAKFATRPKLGIASGDIIEFIGGKRRPRINSPHSAPGAIQLFRREVFDAIGGYPMLKTGGIDAAAQIAARMKGWETQSFRDLPVLHHRRTGSGAGGALRSAYRNGRKEYFLGHHPLYMAVKCVRRASERPWIARSVVYGAGYIAAMCGGEKRELPAEFLEHFKQEQFDRLRSMLRPWRSRASRDVGLVGKEEA
jgi:glycosyltransferase involved in cell wall biosynthesis